ncbi:hypothetical protein BDB01DRAFT_839926 [Pilobolus umbonatus]|nr:hypothetical protein BDB01DRAFT_839926 [Pilobolus umbonatus]
MLAAIKNFFGFGRPSMRRMVLSAMEDLYTLEDNLRVKNRELYNAKLHMEDVIAWDNKKLEDSIRELGTFDDEWKIFLDSPTMISSEEEIAVSTKEREWLVGNVHACNGLVERNKKLYSSIQKDLEVLCFRLQAVVKSSMPFDYLFVDLDYLVLQGWGLLCCNKCIEPLVEMGIGWLFIV